MGWRGCVLGRAISHFRQKALCGQIPPAARSCRLTGRWTHASRLFSVTLTNAVMTPCALQFWQVRPSKPSAALRHTSFHFAPVCSVPPWSRWAQPTSTAAEMPFFHLVMSAHAPQCPRAVSVHTSVDLRSSSLVRPMSQIYSVPPGGSPRCASYLRINKIDN